MGLLNKKSGFQASHHGASLQDSAQLLRRHSAPENAQNPSSPHETTQPHQISITRTPASSTHHAGRDGLSSHAPSHSQTSKQPSHRNTTLKKLLLSMDTHLQIPKVPSNYSPERAPYRVPDCFGAPNYQESSLLVPLEAPVSPKTDQMKIRVDFRAPKYQHSHCSTTSDSPVSPGAPESLKHTPQTQHSGPPHHSSDMQPLINSTNSLSLAHRPVPSHQAHSSVQADRCNSCHWVAGLNPHCRDCKAGIPEFLNATSQSNGQTTTTKRAMCGKPAEANTNRCMACKNKNADFLQLNSTKNLHK